MHDAGSPNKEPLITITPVHPDDLQVLKGRVRVESDAKARDRCRCVLLAIDGLTAPQIAQRIDRSRSFVQRWCYAYRDHGLEGLTPKHHSGRPPLLVTTQRQTFKQRILDGPTDTDGVCTLRGVDAQRILQDEFGVSYSLNGVYKLLHQLNLSVLVPRPQHRKSDPQAMAKWVEDAPFLSKK
ncbi:MAG: IS630 family transposase [Phycisphaeraceae bacterium]